MQRGASRRTPSAHSCDKTTASMVLTGPGAFDLSVQMSESDDQRSHFVSVSYEKKRESQK